MQMLVFALTAWSRLVFFSRSLGLCGFALAGALLLSSAAEAQQDWSFQTDPHGWRGTARVVNGAGISASLACTKPGTDPAAYPGGTAIVPHQDGMLGFFVQSAGLGVVGLSHNETVVVSVEVDGANLGQAPMAFVAPQQELGVNVPVDHPFVAALRSGKTLRLMVAKDGKALELPLEKSGPAISQLLVFCSSPLSVMPKLTAAKTSFDCTRASTPTEIAICSNEKLAREDLALDKAYRTAIAAMAAPQAAMLSKFQKDWLNVRDKCGAEVGCLSKAMSERISELQSLQVAQTNPPPAPPQAKTPTAGTVPPQQARVLVEDGVWYGPLTCKRIKRGEARLTISPQNPDGTFKADLLIGTASSLMGGTTVTSYLGELRNDDVHFVVTKSQRGGIGQTSPQGFVFSPRTGEGTFEAGDCTKMSLTPLTSDSPRMRITVSLPAGGGSYQRATNERDKCEAVIGWTDRLKREYPEIDFYRSSSNDALAWKMVKLFADDDFVPVFGAPFDAIPYEARKQIWQEIQKLCYRNPFTKNRMENYRSAADRAFADGNGYQELTSNGYSATVLAIREIRRVRNEIAALESGAVSASGGLSFEAAVKSLNQLDATITERSELLWPSETAGAKDRISRRIQNLAQNEANALLQNFLREETPARSLEQSAAMVTKLSGPLGQELAAADKSSILKAVADRRDLMASRLTAPTLQQASSAPQSLEGAKAILAMAASAPPAGLLKDQEVAAFRKALDAEVEQRLAAHVQTEIAALNAIAVTREGLAQSAAWATQFGTQTKEFDNRRPVEDAWAQYRSHREALLEALLPAFSEDIGTASDAATAQQIFASYVGWEGDPNLPIYLEYELAKELAQ